MTELAQKPNCSRVGEGARARTVFLLSESARRTHRMAETQEAETPFHFVLFR